MGNKVFVVTVTYGNRFHLLKQVIDSALSEGVHKIIVADNLKEYEKSLNDKIEVLYLDDNYGSAGGFKRGLQVAYNDPECEFIWLLDDDNKSMNGSLKILLDFWDSLEIENKKERIALLSYRFKKEQLAKKQLSKNKPDSDKKFGIVPVAPCGGLFIHKNLLNKIGYPNEKFYLYADDHEWSYRITKIGGGIYLILDSKIDDLELSWHIPKSVKETRFSVISRGNPYRVYYSIRNRVFFEINNLVDNKMIYWINILVYLLLISLSSRKNVRIILKAIKDGYRGRLGRIEEIG